MCRKFINDTGDTLNFEIFTVTNTVNGTFTDSENISVPNGGSVQRPGTIPTTKEEIIYDKFEVRASKSKFKDTAFDQQGSATDTTPIFSGESTATVIVVSSLAPALGHAPLAALAMLLVGSGVYLVRDLQRTRTVRLAHASDLGGHPKPAKDGHLKTGQRS